MLVIAHHQVKNPDVFWSRAKELTPVIPSYLKLHSVFPSKDLFMGTCVWEGPNVQTVQKFLDDNLGIVSVNICYEVEASLAMGLPQALETKAVVA